MVELTRDNWWEVFSYCDERTHAVLRQVCKGFNDISKKHIKPSIHKGRFNEQLEEYSRMNKFLHLKSLIDKYHKYLRWNSGLYGACEGGHRDIAKWMISLGASNWDRGLLAACRGGHRSVAEWMISLGAKNFNRGLIGACEYGHRDIAEWMISLGADKWDNTGLYYACKNGHTNTVELLIEKGYNCCYWCHNTKHPQLQ